MSLTIPVAHDFVCPWCWVGLHQAKRLMQEEGIMVEWRGFELFPEGMDFEEEPTPEVIPNRPPTPSRFQIHSKSEGVMVPDVQRPKHMRTGNAHEAAEYAKSKGKGFEFVEALYRAYWEKGIDISNVDYLVTLGKAFELDPDDLKQAVETHRFKEAITPFDDPAHKLGVFNVPTFFIGADRWAEQSYEVLSTALRKVHPSSPAAPYADISFSNSVEKRPYVVMDMVATIDGKIISGERDEPVLDLGSKLDHEAMRNLERAVDAVLIGSRTLAATPVTWKTQARVPLVMSRKGKVNLDHGFLSTEEAIIILPDGVDLVGRTTETVMRSMDPNVDPSEILKKLKKHGVDRLLILGGSEVNSVFLRDDLVDEIFLTIAPKVKLGADVPTMAGGQPLRRDELLNFDLVTSITIKNEAFLRYRRRPV